MNRNCELVCALLLLVAATTYAEVVNFKNCTNLNQTADKPVPISNCTIHEVRVDPCREAPTNKPCQLKRGQSASISFDYTPFFDGDNLKSIAIWVNEISDVPFMGMNTSACATTECPAVSGVRRTYSMDIPISKKYPVRMYDVKWKLWNEEMQECCFIFQIKLHK